MLSPDFRVRHSCKAESWPLSAYEMGARSAQMLLDRLSASAPLPPRSVVLPVKLILRRSCGRPAPEGGPGAFNLPLQGLSSEQVVEAPLVAPERPDAF